MIFMEDWPNNFWDLSFFDLGGQDWPFLNYDHRIQQQKTENFAVSKDRKRMKKFLLKKKKKKKSSLQTAEQSSRSIIVVSQPQTQKSWYKDALDPLFISSSPFSCVFTVIQMKGAVFPPQGALSQSITPFLKAMIPFINSMWWSCWLLFFFFPA